MIGENSEGLEKNRQSERILKCDNRTKSCCNEETVRRTLLGHVVSQSKKQ